MNDYFKTQTNDFEELANITGKKVKDMNLHEISNIMDGLIAQAFSEYPLPEEIPYGSKL